MSGSQELAGRTCIVTGGARGIGRVIARTFAAHGAAVVVGDQSSDGGKDACAEIQRAGGKARAVQTDVADRPQIARLVQEAADHFGGVDIVIHNAAVYPLRAFADIDAALLDRTLTVNLAAAFWLTQEALPFLRGSGHGRVLVTSSVTGPRVAYPGLAHYCASKAGINGFIRAAALELARDGITVNGVEPGMIETPASSNLGDDADQARLVRHIPLGRLGRPEDIANAMLFLASDAASYITGQTIIVDGGALLPECGVLQPTPSAP